MINKWIKKDIRNQSSYKVKTTPYQIKLNQNESPFDWPTNIKKEISHTLLKNNWNRYPNLIQTSLKKKIGYINNIDGENVMIGKGSNEILHAIFTASIRSNDIVASLSPTFAVYQMLTEQRGAAFIESKLDSAFEVDKTDLLSKSSKAKLTIICNPNSPTGSMLPINFIEDIIKHTSGLVVVDEAYVDFSGVSAISFLSKYSNLIVTRTLSKAFAMAGFRIGYGLMDYNIAQEIQKCLLPFNFDMPSAVALNTILDQTKLVKKRAKEIVSERDKLISELNTIEGVNAVPSHSNFFLLSTKYPPGVLFDYCSKNGILIRNVSSYSGLESFVRITVGNPKENETFIKIIKEMF